MPVSPVLFEPSPQVSTLEAFLRHILTTPLPPPPQINEEQAQKLRSLFEMLKSQYNPFDLNLPAIGLGRPQDSIYGGG